MFGRVYGSRDWSCKYFKSIEHCGLVLTENIFFQKQLNEDKTLNEEAFKNYISNEVATQDYQKAVAEDVATKCFESSKQTSHESDESATCSNLPKRAMKCVMKGFFEACPADSQDQSEQCVKMREMVKGHRGHGPH